MMKKHEQREQIFKLLFREEFHSCAEMDEQVKLFFEDEELSGISEKDMNYITEKYQKVRGILPELDKLLDEKVEGWNTARMGKVDLTILRLAVYEMLYDEEVPEGVAINEAVELARKYEDEDVVAFVNGILGSFARELEK